MRQIGKKKKKTKVIDLNLTILIITLSINRLMTPIKRQRLLDWIKNKTQLYAVYKRKI